jgi:hypothetical protein
MSKKYAGAKQTEDCSNCFNHLTHPNFCYFCKRLIIGLCFTTASSAGKMISSVRQNRFFETR